MSTSALVTDGFGSFGDIAHIVTLGLDIGQVVAVNEFAYTIMRLSQINVETAALIVTTAVAGGTMSAIKNVATIMRSSAINAEGDMSAGPINAEADML